MSTVPGIVTRLYVRPERQTFGPEDEPRLVTHLNALASATNLRGVSTVAELQMQPDCRTVTGGFRYMYPAFAGIANKAISGASKLLADLAGVIRTDRRGQEVDGGFALRIFNRAVDLRFSRYQHVRLIRNEQACTIDSAVDSAYYQYDNVRVYERIAEALARYRPEAHFHAAAVECRDLRAWFRADETIDVPYRNVQQRFTLGYMLQTGEGTKQAIRMAWCLFGPAGTMLAPFKSHGIWVPHIGEDVGTRVDQALQPMLQRQLPYARVREDLLRLSQQRLNVSETISEAELKTRTRTILSLLKHYGGPHGLPSEILEGIVRWSLQSSGLPESFGHRRRVLSRVTSLELFNKIVELARPMDARRRDCTERMAYRFLTEGGITR